MDLSVGRGEAKVRYTIPMPQDSRIAGMEAEEVAIPRPVLSTVTVVARPYLSATVRSRPY